MRGEIGEAVDARHREAAEVEALAGREIGQTAALRAVCLSDVECVQRSAAAVAARDDLCQPEVAEATYARGDVEQDALVDQQRIVADGAAVLRPRGVAAPEQE